MPYHSARLEGKMARSLYRAALPMIVRRRVRVPRELSLDVFAYSGENTLPEQVASIRSFLAYAGRPKQFTVVSDGSYTNASIELLEKIDNCVRVQRSAPPLPPGLPEKVRSYLTNHFTGKQLALIMSLPASGPTLFPAAMAASIARALARARSAVTSVKEFKIESCRLIRDSAASIASSADSSRPVTALAMSAADRVSEFVVIALSGCVDTGRLGFVGQHEFVDQPRQS